MPTNFDKTKGKEKGAECILPKLLLLSAKSNFRRSICVTGKETVKFLFDTFCFHSEKQKEKSPDTKLVVMGEIPARVACRLAGICDEFTDRVHRPNFNIIRKFHIYFHNQVNGDF